MEPWDQRYNREDSSYDWYISATECCDIVEPLAGMDDEILHVGCGTSEVGAELYRRGKHYVTNIDTSKTAVQIMAQRGAQFSDMQYVEMDVTRLPRDLTSVFQLVLDKALLDCLLCEPKLEKAERYLAEVKRVLKPGGVFCCISHGVPDKRSSLIAMAFGLPASRVKVTSIAKPIVPGIDSGASPNYFVYTVTQQR